MCVVSTGVLAGSLHPEVVWCVKSTNHCDKWGLRHSARAISGRVTDADFDRVLGHLNAALVEAGAEDGTIRGVLTAIEARRGEVVGA